MRKLFTLSGIAFLMLSGLNANAQSTWQDVRAVLQTHCNSNTCHGSGTPNASFNVDTTSHVLFTQLVNATPINPYAKDSVGAKIIFPGVPQLSYMLRKLARCQDGSLALIEPYEGDPMPQNQPKVSDTIISLIYEWIIQGASETDTISPDFLAGDICDTFVGISSTYKPDVSFSVFPNPVSEDFSVSYTLKKQAQVSIELLDAKGMRTSVLSSCSQSAGTFNESFDTDLPNGVYFIRLTIDGDQYLRKLVVL